MKINTNELQLNEPMTINVTGLETWLQPLYEHFKNECQSVITHLLTGNIKLERIGDSQLKVYGHVFYSPMVSCDRCSETFPWKINEKFQYYYQDQVSCDKILEDSKSQGNSFLQDGQFDLFALINETIVVAVPYRTVPKVENDDSCSVCHMNTASSQVYSSKAAASGASDKSCPFSCLKTYKFQR